MVRHEAVVYAKYTTCNYKLIELVYLMAPQGVPLHSWNLENPGSITWHPLMMPTTIPLDDKIVMHHLAGPGYITKHYKLMDRYHQYLKEDLYRFLVLSRNYQQGQYL